MKSTIWNVNQRAFTRNEKVFDSGIKLLIENGMLIQNEVQNKRKDKSPADKISNFSERTSSIPVNLSD